MRLWLYIVILTGVMIFMSMAGLPSGTNDLKQLIGYNEGTNHTIQNVTLTTSPFMGYLFNLTGDTGMLGLLATLIGLTGIAVGLYVKTGDTNILLLPFVVIVAIKWLQTFIGIMNYAVGLGDTFITPIIVLLFLPLSVGFIISCVEWVRGTD
jgi:hypothetical protein